MKFIQPTVSLSKLLSLVVQRSKPTQLEQELSKIFSNTPWTLTDSGRSALAFVIEQLDLTGSTLALPAFICDVLWPVLKKYQITPIFLDVNPDNFQPSLSEYKQKITPQVQAILVCRTFGLPINKEEEKFLQQSGKIIIEDRAHLPYFSNKSTFGQSSKAYAYYYSLPKMMSAPDGGLAVVSTLSTEKHQALPSGKPNVALLKRYIQTTTIGRSFVNFLKQALHLHHLANPEFTTIRRLSNLSQKILLNFLQTTKNTSTDSLFCLPALTREREEIHDQLQKFGLYSETLWEKPIIAHPEVQPKYDPHGTNFPQTKKIAQEILCVPRIATTILKNSRPPELTQVWDQWQRYEAPQTPPTRSA